MARLLLLLIGFTAVVATSLASADSSVFYIQQDGASCKAAVPSTQGTTLDSKYRLGVTPGWVICVIDQRAPYYYGAVSGDQGVAELHLGYTLPPSIEGFDIGSGHSVPGIRPSRARPSMTSSVAFGCSMDGVGPIREGVFRGQTELKFSAQLSARSRLPSHVLCYLPARTTVDSLNWTYFTER